MIEVVIFDFDGVLVESVDIKTRAFAKLFEAEGAEVVDRVVDYHLRNSGVSRFEKFRYIYTEFLYRPLSDVIFQDLCRRFSELVLEEVVSAPYVAGAKEFLENNAGAYSCFVCSATPQDEIEEIVKLREMERYFKGVFGAPRTKGDIVRNILASYDVCPGDAVYIGDAWSDYEAATENSVNFVARINCDETVFSDVDCVKVNDLTGLKTLLDSMQMTGT